MRVTVGFPSRYKSELRFPMLLLVCQVIHFALALLSAELMNLLSTVVKGYSLMYYCERELPYRMAVYSISSYKVIWLHETSKRYIGVHKSK